MRRHKLLLILLGLLATPLWAQEPSPDSSGPWGSADLDSGAVLAEIDRTQQASVPAGLADGESEEFKKEVQRRVQVLRDLHRSLTDRDKLPPAEELRGIAGRARGDLADLEEKAPEEVPTDLTEQQFAAQEQELRDLIADRDALDLRVKDRHKEISGLASRIMETQKRAATLARLLDDPDQRAPGPLGDYRRETTRMELRAAQEAQAYEQRLAAIGADLLDTREAELQVLSARLQRKEAFVAAARSIPLRQHRLDLQQHLRTKAAAEAELAQVRSRLESEPRSPEQTAPLLLAELNHRSRAGIAAVRAETSRHLAFRIATVLPLRDAENKVNQTLALTRERLKTRFGGGAGGARTTELLLVNLERVTEHRRRLARKLQPEVSDLLKENLGYRSRVYEQLWPLETSLDEEPEELRTLLAALPPEGWDEARRVHARLARELKKALETRLDALEEVITVLLEVDDRIYRERRRMLDEIETFIITRIYWVRSDDPVGVSTLVGVKDEVAQLAFRYTDPGLWRETTSGYARGTWLLLPTTLGFLLLVAFGIFLARRLKNYHTRWKYRGGPVLVFLQRLAMSALLSLLAPACLLLAAILLRALSLPDALGLPAWRLLVGLALVWFARRFLWTLFREGGIAAAEMRVPPAVTNQLGGIGSWACAAGAFLVLPWWILASDPPALEHLPRLLFAAILAALAILLSALLRPRGALMTSVTGGRGLLFRTWFFLSPVVMLGLFAIVLMDLLGYRFGARLLVGNVLQTLLAALALVVIYNLITSVVEQMAQRVRRRALRETGTRQEAREQSEEALTQVTRLLSIAVIVTAVVLLAGFWGISSSLRSFFEAIHLHTVDAAADLYLTLWDVLTALAWIVGGHFLIRHLPGLYEALLFSRLERVEQGTRFVAVAVSKYLIILVVYSAAVLALHISFASLGYVVAALSLGIGFGLQEIVSNFVSGLILLIERPVRVGDVISVGTTVGTVEQISIRATQVVNLDRQVIIIPNRKFISEDVTNWSHNDAIVRSSIDVGVSYGSDVEKVGRVLLEALQAHPKVLSDPEPKVVFMTFGDSSLNFKVRPFTLIENRVQTVHELNEDIVRRFRAEGIEIPFPQRDLHLRSIEEETLLAALEARGPGGTKKGSA